MKFCQNCGAQVDPNNSFCPTCGGPLGDAPLQQPTPTTDANDTQTDKVLAIVSYIGFIGLVLHYAKVCKTDFGKFHALQATNLFIIEIGLDVVCAILQGMFRLIHLSFVGSIFGMVAGLAFIFNILGIVYACQGKKEEFKLVLPEPKKL